MVMGVCLRRFCLSMSVVWDIVCSELGQDTTGCSVKCCFGVMYCEWYGACDFVVLSAVEVCSDYIHTANIIFTNIILMANKHNIPKARCIAVAGSCPKTKYAKSPKETT